MTHTEIERIAKLLAGHEPGWQSRFATLLGVSRGYAHNLLTGERKISGQLLVKLADAARARVEVYKARAADLEEFLKPATVEPTPEPEPIPEPEPPVTQYSRYAENAIQHEFVAGVLDDLLDDEDK